MPTVLSQTPKTAGSRSKILFFSVAVVALVGVWLKRQLVPTHRYLPWHQTPYWREFLQVYDQQASKYYLSGGDCEAKLLDTTYGPTHVFACGSKDRPPVFFFHGASLNALLYGNWILPKLQNRRYVVAVDHPCDLGRSLPADLDPKRCPQTDVELADWVRQIVVHKELGVNGRASLVGYSYGGYASALAARHHSSLIDKVVLLGPACVFDDIASEFVWRATGSALVRSRWGQNWMWGWLSVDPAFDLWRTAPRDFAELLDVGREVSGTVFPFPEGSFSDAALEQLTREHLVFLGVGEHERAFTNLSRFIERAHSATLHSVKVYSGAGHLLFLEVAEAVEHDVVAFLLSG